MHSSGMRTDRTLTILPCSLLPGRRGLGVGDGSDQVSPRGGGGGVGVVTRSDRGGGGGDQV